MYLAELETLALEKQFLKAKDDLLQAKKRRRINDDLLQTLDRMLPSVLMEIPEELWKALKVAHSEMYKVALIYVVKANNLIYFIS
jgi:hypothetical protein